MRSETRDKRHNRNRSTNVSINPFLTMITNDYMIQRKSAACTPKCTGSGNMLVYEYIFPSRFLDTIVFIQKNFNIANKKEKNAMGLIYLFISGDDKIVSSGEKVATSQEASKR